MWGIEISRRNKVAGRRGRPKVPVKDLKRAIKLKKETIEQMGRSLSAMGRHTVGQTICESDLEEFDELLSSDEDDDSDIDEVPVVIGQSMIFIGCLKNRQTFKPFVRFLIYS